MHKRGNRPLLYSSPKNINEEPTVWFHTNEKLSGTIDRQRTTPVDTAWNAARNRELG
jgi:hypothetical protein